MYSLKSGQKRHERPFSLKSNEKKSPWIPEFRIPKPLLSNIEKGLRNIIVSFIFELCIWAFFSFSGLQHNWTTFIGKSRLNFVALTWGSWWQGLKFEGISSAKTLCRVNKVQRNYFPWFWFKIIFDFSFWFISI